MVKVCEQRDILWMAKLRDESLYAERNRRVIERKRRIAARNLRDTRVSTSEDDSETKMRSLFAAIRAKTNSDVELTTQMTPSELFHATSSALSELPNRHTCTETKFIGEALTLVAQLNSLLASR